jgi:hypothetical protein
MDIIARRVCLVLAKISPGGTFGNTICGSFRHQRRIPNFFILLLELVMRPPIRTKISQPAPQARCIGFGPGEPRRQAFSIGGAETAVGHHAILPCERPIAPVVTGHSACNNERWVRRSYRQLSNPRSDHHCFLATHQP